MSLPPTVVAVSADATHRFTKPNLPAIDLIAGEGVAGDAHRGATVKHRSRVAADPSQPNLRQVHLIHEELFEELAAQGFTVTPGLIGENITTRGLDLLALPVGTQLRIGPDAIVEVTGLRNPCQQLNDLAPGLMEAVLDRDDEGGLVRKSGIMGIVVAGGRVQSGDAIDVTWPEKPWRKLERV